MRGRSMWSAVGGPAGLKHRPTLDRSTPVKRFRFAFLFIACVIHLTLPPPPVAAVGQAPASLTAPLADLDAQLTADFAKDGIGGVSVGVVSGAALVWSKHYGYAD